MKMVGCVHGPLIGAQFLEDSEPHKSGVGNETADLLSPDRDDTGGGCPRGWEADRDEDRGSL